MTQEKRNGYTILQLDSIEALTAASMQADHDCQAIVTIAADVLGRYDCDGVAIVALVVALRDYFSDMTDAYDSEINRRLEDFYTAEKED